MAEIGPLGPRSPVRNDESSVLKLNGAEWALDSSMRDVAKACSVPSTSDNSENKNPWLSLKELKLEDFDLDTVVAAKIIQLLQRHSGSLEHFSFYECTGRVDLVVTVAMTILPKLKTLRIATGRISTSAFDPCASALGVTLQCNQTLQQLSLQSGSNVFFTLSTEAARSLSDGLAQNCMLERFELIGCRFAEASTLQSLARGLRKHCFLKQVRMQSCFQSNGHALDDTAIAELVLALGQHNRQLQVLDLTNNQCVSAGVAAISTLLDRTLLETLNLSCQCIVTSVNDHADNTDNHENVQDESTSISFLNLSLLVAALGRTNTLRHFELRFNQLIDSDMAYLAAALAHNTSIRYLGLSNNRISNVGLSILASRIPSMKGLQYLVLTNNLYDHNGLEELAEAMTENMSLETIELDRCCSSSRGKQDVHTPFKMIRYYTDLNWSGRKYLHGQNHQQSVSPSLWPMVLARTNHTRFANTDGMGRQVDVLYSFLRQGSILFSM